MKLSQTPNPETDDFSDSVIPQNQRIGRVPLSMAWWAVASAMCWFVFASVMAINFGTINALIGLILSVIAYSLINIIFVRFSINTGLSVSLFSRILFGKYGIALASLLFGACATYLSLFEASVVSIAIHQWTPSVSLDMTNFIVVFYSVLLVFGSVQRWLDKFNGFLFPFYLVGLVAAVGMTISKVGLNSKWLELGPANPSKFGWISCFAYLMGVWIMMMFTMDYARFGKKEDLKYHENINFGWVFYFFTYFINGLAGIFIVGSLVGNTSNLNELSVVTALVELMGIFGLIFIWISQTRINTANFYLASLNLQVLINNVFKFKFSRILCSIAIGVIVYFLMTQNIFSYILKALAYQGVFVVSWVTIALIYMLKFNACTDEKSTNLLLEKADGWSGLTTWIISSIIGIIIMESNSSIHELSSLITAVIAAGLYWVLKTVELKKAVPAF